MAGNRRTRRLCLRHGSAGRAPGATTRCSCPPPRPPVGRMVLVNGLEVWAHHPRPGTSLSPPSGTPGGADGQDMLAPARTGFPRRFPRGALAALDLPVPRRHAHRAGNLHPPGHRPDRPRLATARPGCVYPGGASALLRPAITTRCTTRTTPSPSRPSPRRAAATCSGSRIPACPGVRVWSSGTYRHEPAWYQPLPLLHGSAPRGLDDPGRPRRAGRVRVRSGPQRHRRPAPGQRGPLARRPTRRAAPSPPRPARAISCPPCARTRNDAGAFDADPPSPRAGYAYLVRGGRGQTVIAGYPWFTDWGRDTFISLRGLCLAAGRFEGGARHPPALVVHRCPEG